MTTNDIQTPKDTTEADSSAGVSCAAASGSPCLLPCPKCGSTDIHRAYRKAGDRGDYNHDMPDRLDQRKPTHPIYPIKAEYILHVCRCCSYRWGTDTLAANNTTNAPERLSPAGLLAVGDAAELTFTRSSQGHIEIEVRTKLGLVKVRVTESNYAALMFGQAHVPGEVVRYLPTRGVVGSANAERSGPAAQDSAT